MSVDKRTVSTDALATLGTIIQDGGRDAIHLAVEPVVAGEVLIPGANIGISNGKAYYAGDGIKALGIADPFLQSTINVGEKFWLIVYPRQITSLRHVWEHPDFETKVGPTISQQQAERWLKDFCLDHDCPDYETVMTAIKGGKMDGRFDGDDVSYSFDDQYLTFYGIDAHCSIPPEFWIYVEIVLGRKPTHTPSHFSCSC